MSRFSVFTVLAVTATVPALVLAASTTSTSTTLVATTTTVTSEAPHEPSAGTVTLSPTAQTRITNLTANLSNREDATVRRLQNVSDRLASRLAILKATGKDVTVATAHLADTKSNLDIAKTNLNTIDKAVATFVGSSNPRESWGNLKTTYTNINVNIRAAHDALKEAVAAAETANATTAPAVTASTTATTTKAKQ